VTSPPAIGAGWPGARPLVTDTRSPGLDLSAAIGQMQYTFRFALTDGVSGENLGDLTPIRDANLRHDTAMTTKRELRFPLSVADTAAINPLTERVSVFMVLPAFPCPDTSTGDWPLGRYMWVDESRKVTTGGNLGSETLTDEMFLIDQEIISGISGYGRNIPLVIADVLTGLPVTIKAEPCPFSSAEAWGIGAGRGGILESLAQSGDYWSPWFDNVGDLRFRRTFDPANAVVDIDLDAGYRVLRDSIVETDDILTSPNTIIVVSNASNTPSDPCVGIATVPPSAPNSVANRGFPVVRTYNLQLFDATQAQSVANGIMQRQAIFEQVNLATPADPRYDSYNVIRWAGDNWLNLSWSMRLVAGAPMTQTMRRSHAA
jgi:hypothetical protein